MTMRRVIVVGLVVVALAAGILGYAVFRPPQEASAPITAVPLASGAANASGTTTAAAASPAASSTTQGSASGSASTATGATVTTTAGDAVVMQIVQNESQARFVIDEVLNNAPKTVVGTTNQVAGQLAVNAQNPSATQVGVIQINARTLTSDSEFRNRAIKNQILRTDTYEFVTFKPKQLIGLPQTGTVGQTYTFKIVGDLTIRDTTREVTFDTTVTPSSNTRLQGKAQTTIRYADFGITIPQARAVASVSDQVRLEIDFVAAVA